MAGTKRKSIESSTPSKKTKATPDNSSNKRKLSDPPIPVVEELSAKKSNRSKTPSKKILEIQEQSPASVNLTTAEQRQKAIEWAAQSLPNLRKSPKPPASSKKTPASSKKEKSSSPAIEPIKQNSPEKTISIPAVNTPVPKPSANTAQKRIRVKKVPSPITTTSTTTITTNTSSSSNKAYPLPIPGTQGFAYAVPIIIFAILLYYLYRK